MARALHSATGRVGSAGKMKVSKYIVASLQPHACERESATGEECGECEQGECGNALSLV